MKTFLIFHKDKKILRLLSKKIYFFKFQKTANLLFKTRISNGVYVKDKGWFIFGGDGNENSQAQKLDSINGNWVLGPDLNNRVFVYGQCYFQV